MLYGDRIKTKNIPKCLEITYINMVKELVSFRSNNCHILFKNSHLRNNNQSNQNTILQIFKSYVMIAHHRNFFNNFQKKTRFQISSIKCQILQYIIFQHYIITIPISLVESKNDLSSRNFLIAIKTILFLIYLLNIKKLIVYTKLQNRSCVGL